MTCKLMYISDQNDVELHAYPLPITYNRNKNKRKPAFNAANIRCIEHVGKCRRYEQYKFRMRQCGHRGVGYGRNDRSARTSSTRQSCATAEVGMQFHCNC